MKVVSLFSGAGGLDLGFEKAGYDIVWANENDKSIQETFRHNFPKAILDTRSIADVPSGQIPEADGIIGGPPCQSWSEAGALRGINDHRGQLFFEYVRVLKDKRPLFFLAENVPGILFDRHRNAFNEILRQFEEIGYTVSYNLLNAKDYGVPQDRKRVIIIGYRSDIGKKFDPPDPLPKKVDLKDAIWDLQETAVPAGDLNKSRGSLQFPNHEYMNGGFSTIYMSRNRVRNWDEPSFTIQAGGRHAPLHPRAPKMIPVCKDKMEFVRGSEGLYRRLSVRECARIQAFPDDFIFKYKSVADGYKMVGNAVPVEFARNLALKIKEDLLPMNVGKRVKGNGFKLKQRKFNGKDYTLFDWCSDLVEAKEETCELRAEGKYSRYTQNKDGYSIWVRDKEKAV